MLFSLLRPYLCFVSPGQLACPPRIPRGLAQSGQPPFGRAAACDPNPPSRIRAHPL